MKLFDWSSPAVAAKYIAKADKKRATERTIKLLSRQTLTTLYKRREALRRKRDRLNLEIGKLSLEIKRLTRSGIEKRKADRARDTPNAAPPYAKPAKAAKPLAPSAKQFGISTGRRQTNL